MPIPAREHTSLLLISIQDFEQNHLLTTSALKEGEMSGSTAPSEDEHWSCLSFGCSYTQDELPASTMLEHGQLQPWQLHINMQMQTAVV